MSKTDATATTTTAANPEPPSSTTILSKDLPPKTAEKVKAMFGIWGSFRELPEQYTLNDSYSDIYRNLLKVRHLKRGGVSCVFTVLPVVMNYYNGTHGGAVAAIAERISIACARTVVKEDTEIFLGELAMSYLSAATPNEVVLVDGSVVRSGRNLTVVAVEFRIKETGKLAYTARATIYHMPPSKL